MYFQILGSCQGQFTPTFHYTDYKPTGCIIYSNPKLSMTIAADKRLTKIFGAQIADGWQAIVAHCESETQQAGSPSTGGAVA